MNEITEKSTDVAADIDGTIRRGMLTFVEVGRALMRMRDQQLYRHLPKPYASFREYVDDIEGITPEHARVLINQSLTYNAIVDGEDASSPSPKTQSQIQALITACVANRKRSGDRFSNWIEAEREVTTANGERKVVKQVVDIRPKTKETLRSEWNRVVEAHERHKQEVTAWNAGHPDEPRKVRPLSAKFVHENLSQRIRANVDTPTIYRKQNELAKVMSKLTRLQQQIDAKLPNGDAALATADDQDWHDVQVQRFMDGADRAIRSLATLRDALAERQGVRS